MEMQGSRTQGNLQAALSRESRNRLRYEWYAQQAKAHHEITLCFIQHVPPPRPRA